MSRPEWILCERSNDWIAGLRKSLQRESAAKEAIPRLREVRNLSDAAVILEELPDCFVLIEVHRENLADALTFLSEAGHRFVYARVAVLVDRAIASNQADRQLIADALLEAGAVAAVDSPRRLRGMFPIAQRHAATLTGRVAVLHRNASVVEQAWASLPWQDK